MRASITALLTASALAAAGTAAAQSTLPADIPEHFAPVQTSFDYQRREIDIAMRDGVKLHVSMVVPK